MNPMQIIQLIKGGQNPQQLVMQILQQQAQNNPMCANLLELVKNNKAADVDEYNNVFSSIFLDVPKGCCSQISVKNLSTQAINVQNANLIVERVA